MGLGEYESNDDAHGGRSAMMMQMMQQQQQQQGKGPWGGMFEGLVGGPQVQEGTWGHLMGQPPSGPLGRMAGGGGLGGGVAADEKGDKPAALANGNE